MSAEILYPKLGEEDIKPGKMVEYGWYDEEIEYEEEESESETDSMSAEDPEYDSD